MRRVLASVFVAMLTTAAMAAAGSTLPVQVGGKGEKVACAPGQIKELDPKGDSFVAVRVGPGTDYDEIDKLGSGDLVNICDKRGNWLGIVYGSRDCGVAKPIVKPQPYLGVCKTGWVPVKAVGAVAG